jgi:hypothetical protein
MSKRKHGENDEQLNRLERLRQQLRGHNEIGEVDPTVDTTDEDEDDTDPSLKDSIWTDYERTLHVTGKNYITYPFDMFVVDRQKKWLNAARKRYNQFKLGSDDDEDEGEVIDYLTNSQMNRYKAEKTDIPHLMRDFVKLREELEKELADAATANKSASASSSASASASSTSGSAAAAGADDSYDRKVRALRQRFPDKDLGEMIRTLEVGGIDLFSAPIDDAVAYLDNHYNPNAAQASSSSSGSTSGSTSGSSSGSSSGSQQGKGFFNGHNYVSTGKRVVLYK